MAKITFANLEKVTLPTSAEYEADAGYIIDIRPQPGIKVSGYTTNLGSVLSVKYRSIEVISAVDGDVIYLEYTNDEATLTSRYTYSNLYGSVNGASGISLLTSFKASGLPSIASMELNNGENTVFFRWTPLLDGKSMQVTIGTTTMAEVRSGVVRPLSYTKNMLVDVGESVSFKATIQGGLVEVTAQSNDAKRESMVIESTLSGNYSTQWRVLFNSKSSPLGISGTEFYDFILTGDGSTVDSSYVAYFLVDQAALDLGFVRLPVFLAGNPITVNVNTGTAEAEGQDFRVDSESRLIWRGMPMENDVVLGDYIRVQVWSDVVVSPDPAYEMRWSNAVRMLGTPSTLDPVIVLKGVSSMGDIFAVHAWTDSVSGYSGSSWGSSNFASREDIPVGVYDANTVMRAMMRPAVPEGGSPKKATLRMYIRQFIAKNIPQETYVLIARPLLYDWDRNYVTAVYRGNGVNWLTPGCGIGSDASGTVMDRNVLNFNTDIGPLDTFSPPIPPNFVNDGDPIKNTSSLDNYVDIDITNCVRFWENNPNYGIMLEADSEVVNPGMPPSFLDFWASTCSDEQRRPYITVEY